MIINLCHPGDPDRVLFKHSELACRRTDRVLLADGFADKLVMLRIAFAQPMIVNSCCRSLAHNRDIAGHPRSLHIYNENPQGLNGCAAIDIRTPNVVYAGLLIAAAWREGWSIGVSRTFVHLDRRDFAGLPAGVFGY